MADFAIQPVIKDPVTEIQIIILQKNDSFSIKVLSSVNNIDDSVKSNTSFCVFFISQELFQNEK
jgi:hypothetical protein